MAQTHTAHHDIIMPTEPVADEPVIRKITFDDLGEVLAKGWSDFMALKTHVVFIALIYPIAGLVLARFLFGYELVPMLYPLALGFALIGPFAAVGLYELSRRREMGRDTSWQHALDIRFSPSRGAILGLGLLLLGIFAVWLYVADGIYVALFGYREPVPLGAFLSEVFTTRQGHNLIAIGNGFGLMFAILVLALSAISFPLLLDRHVSLGTAMATSLRAFAHNPLVMLTWGIIVLALLAIGMAPAFLGLIVVFPLLGHATWHLYRKLVEPDDGPRPDYAPGPIRIRYAADFPASLFVPSSRRKED